jgi:two-component system, chemotaxis family, chemotaxis protein CheY
MKRLVLFVDDDIDVREAYSDLLELNGWQVAHAGDGFEALEWLSANPPPDIILLDLKMPRCDGYQFRVAQLAEPRWREIPTLVFTGDANVEGARLPSLGGAPVVRKSADFEKLLTLLDQIAKKI